MEAWHAFRSLGNVGKRVFVFTNFQACTIDGAEILISINMADRAEAIFIKTTETGSGGG